MKATSQADMPEVVVGVETMEDSGGAAVDGGA
jgi:hypothetical protein